MFSGPMSLYFWKNGTSKETIEVLNTLGLSKSYGAILNLVADLSNHCDASAQTEAQDPNGFMIGHDNLDLSSSIHVEQRSSAPAKVQSGTYAIMYKLLNSNPDALQLSPLLRRAQASTGLDFSVDLSLTHDQLSSAFHQFRCYILNVLFKYNPKFSNARPAKHHSFSYKARRQLSSAYRTRQYPLKITTISEATIAGNIKVIDNIHITQLRLSHTSLANRCILSINDQSTNSHLRSAQALRAQDVNPFTRLQCLQLGIGLFHLCLNLVWALLNVHRGYLDRLGSLAYWFVILKKKRLGSPHPDYHTLLVTMRQVLDGLLLDCWRIQSGCIDLTIFLESKPSAEVLTSIAETILLNHAMPNSSSMPSSPGDYIHSNVRLLIHDLLYVMEVTRAISDGDFGRVEDVLPNLAMMFRGAGSKNYCSEILMFIHNMRKVWKGSGFEYVFLSYLHTYG